jgi:hypothetical protein
LWFKKTSRAQREIPTCLRSCFRSIPSAAKSPINFDLLPVHCGELVSPIRKAMPLTTMQTMVTVSYCMITSVICAIVLGFVLCASSTEKSKAVGSGGLAAFAYLKSGRSVPFSLSSSHLICRLAPLSFFTFFVFCFRSVFHVICRLASLTSLFRVPFLRFLCSLCLWLPPSFVSFCGYFLCR